MKKLFLILVISSVVTCRGGEGYSYVCENGAPKEGTALTQNDNKCQTCNEDISWPVNSVHDCLPMLMYAQTAHPKSRKTK